MRLRISISPANTDEADHRRQHAIFLDRRLAEDERALESRRQGERDLLGAEQRVEQLLGDDRAADGRQNLLQMLAVDRLHDQPLEHPAEGAAHQRRRDHREDEDREIEETESALDQFASGTSTSVAT